MLFYKTFNKGKKIMSSSLYTKPLELLIATHNPGKTVEYRKLFSQTNIKLFFADDQIFKF